MRWFVVLQKFPVGRGGNRRVPSPPPPLSKAFCWSHLNLKCRQVKIHLWTKYVSCSLIFECQFWNVNLPLSHHQKPGRQNQLDHEPLLDLQCWRTQKCDLTYSKFYKISVFRNVREVSWFYWDHRLLFQVLKSPHRQRSTRVLVLGWLFSE